MQANHKLIISLVVIHSLASGIALANHPDSTKTTIAHELVLDYLMQAELAASRNLYQEALENYLKVAELTKDPEIAEIAAEYALELKDGMAVVKAVRLWAENAPDDLEAQLIALSLFIDQEPTQAMPFLQQAFKVSNTDGLEEHLVTILYKITDYGRNNLTTLTKTLADENINNYLMQLAMANILANQLMLTEAKPYLEQTFKLMPANSSAIQLQAKLIRHETKSDDKALEYLKSNLKKYPDDFMLREFYTNALIDSGKTKQAVEQLQILSKHQEYGADAALQLGEYYLSTNDYKNANKYFHIACKNEHTQDLAYYNLGQVAEQQQQTIQAIEWYTKINPGSEHHTNGYLRAASLYSASKKYDVALHLLQHTNPKNFDEQKEVLLTQINLLMDLKDYEEANNTATHVLNIIPDDIDFLYARSIVLNNLKQYQSAEEDLRSVIKIDPNHANALNALAYTLGNQPGKISQAITYVDKALTLIPNNPAFLDSKGWLLFKNGEIAQSLTIFQQAYKLSQEAMVAIHYGEVLWTAGKHNDAKKVWAKALKSHADNLELQETLSKYNLNPKDLF